ncbi:MAG TPA: transaldolase family protein [Ktedonobacteraceae bacterium]|nr:transaldolase family protein [Ktedonobacteraceae bacterium]
MALYVDSAFLQDITNVVQAVPLAGVTTNPTILLQARERGQELSPQRVLNELLHLMDGAIFIQPGATTDEDMYQEALTYIQANPGRVIPKIPMTFTGMRVAQRLKRQQHRIAFTAVTSVAQAYSAAMAGADYVIPYYGRMERSGIDASERISEIAGVLHNAGLPTRILVASIKSGDDAARALLAGADDLTIAPQVLLNMITDPLTEEAIERFSQDWQKMNKL